MLKSDYAATRKAALENPAVHQYAVRAPLVECEPSTVESPIKLA
ncbi:hypothetical protein GQ600_12038 [Phytophthora cactorum]|nr:hypothetical protein GQ600_12038 [Phytophthora cactorum]